MSVEIYDEDGRIVLTFHDRFRRATCRVNHTGMDSTMKPETSSDPIVAKRFIDLWEAQGLDERERIETALIDAVNEAGATLLHIHLHTFEEGGGISGVAVLAESHISVHTWPEKGFAAFDVFMCGDAEPRKALEVFKRAFEPGRVVVGEHKRGVI